MQDVVCSKVLIIEDECGSDLQASIECVRIKRKIRKYANILGEDPIAQGKIQLVLFFTSIDKMQKCEEILQAEGCN